MNELAGKDRLIVALDVPSYEEAISLVRKLSKVHFFKIGLQLFLTGKVLNLIQELRQERGGQVFLDIKWGGDIGNTATEFIQACIANSVVKFITLIEAADKRITEQTINAGKLARKAEKVEYPHFLMVPYLSSLDSNDLNKTTGRQDVDSYILDRAKAMIALGCDGLIVSGSAIRLCRQQLGNNIDIVCPGIRPSGAAPQDHKRFTTPSEAIEMGADYLVVGRPIIKDSNPDRAAQQFIEEIDRALDRYPRNRSSSSGPDGPERYAMATKSK